MTHIVTTIPVKQFANQFHSIDRNSPDSKFCFILGAGASRGSGIKTGGEMAKEWFADIESFKYFSEEDVRAWMAEEKIDKSRLDEFYGPIYKKRFSLFKDVGYDYLVNEMNDSEPSFGYSVLSQLLTMTRHKVVITTNFDSLVESALYSFTNVRPVVVGHESLAAFARPRAKEPLIAKIHRDLLYHPLNNKEETDEMASPWTSVLEHIFRTHVPIVIGYGGNDGSLMNYLMKIPPCHGMFWCLFGKEEPREDIRNVVAHHCGHFVQMDGFDELMFDIMEAMDYKLIDNIFTDTAERRKREYQEQVEAIREKKKRSDDPKDKMAAAHLSERTPKDNWWHWQLKVDGTDDNVEKERLYKEGIQRTKHPYLMSNYALFLSDVRRDYDEGERYHLAALESEPDDASINASYAFFLHGVKKDYDKAERLYNKALEAEPNNAFINCNYANFLTDRGNGQHRAEPYYIKAIEAEPEDANILGNYANFLTHVSKDYDKAENTYLKALKIDPNHSNNNGNYANFLTHCRKDKKKAQQFYIKSLQTDPNSSNKNASYALFLHEILKDFDEAERYYLKSLAIDPENPVVNGSYAKFLTEIRNDHIKAEYRFQKALETAPDSAATNGNYAIMLRNIKEYEKAEEHYLKVLGIEPDNANFNGSYALFLQEIRKNYSDAERYYLKALESDPKHVINIGNYANFLTAVRKEFDKAELYFIEALEIEPDNANFNANYAQMLLISGRKEAGTPFLEKAFKNCDRDDLILELWFYRYAHYEEHREQAHQEIERVLAKGVRSVGWDFSANIERAITDGHPDPNELKRLAAAISAEKV